MEAFEKQFLRQTYGDLSGERLEEIIRFLADMRERAKPAVSDLNIGRVGSHKLSARDLRVQALSDGGVDVSVAHPGFGWIRVTVSADSARDLAMELSAAAGQLR